MARETGPDIGPLLPTLTLPVADRDHHINSPNAKYALVEYADYLSPNCADGYHVVKELLRDLGEDLCYVFRNFPQTEVHPNSQMAAEAAEAADMQGKFWLMHDRLFEHQLEIDPKFVRKLAQELPLDVHHFDRDLASGDPRRRVEKDKGEGIQSGVQQTPTFFVNGRMHVGSYEFQPLYSALMVHPEPEA